MRKYNKNCIKLTCAEYERAMLNNENPTCCRGCGFDAFEAERRKSIPFTKDSSGKWRKVIKEL